MIEQPIDEAQQPRDHEAPSPATATRRVWPTPVMERLILANAAGKIAGATDEGLFS